MISGSMMNRRYFLGAAGASASALLLSSCARGNSATTAGGDTVTAAGWDDGFQDLVVGPIAKGFESESKTTFQAQAAVSGDDYSTRFRTLLSGGKPPDFMRLDDDFLPEISSKKLAKDIGPYVAESRLNLDDYYENVFNFSKLPTGQRAVQIAAQNRCIFYNKTMFEKEGIPLPPTTWTDEGWKWEDFLEAAKALTKASEDQWGAVIAKDGAYENMWAVNNGGPGTFSKDGHSFTLADEIGLDAMQWCCDLITKHKVCPSWGDLQPDRADQRLFTGGKLGMYQNATSTIAYFDENIKDFEWDVAPIPGRENQIQEASMVMYIIPDKAQNPDLAWDFLEYAIGPEGGKIIADSGIGIPTHRGAAKALKAPGKYPANMNLLVEASDHLRSRNFTNATSAALNIYRPQLERAYTGEITVAEALNGVRDQVEAAIAV
ncbi:extracellular solute-binding protein [Microlunatus soli]|uniref:ABC-type glycerol-3-phosphate transport system, substrate-binding protein n=1 Tax=Microlunatus soli TaxID=630515 RepID=A0A1H1YPA8_9ACTN|nr:extracellular solute-binding protein [Microlunatus soli]SDT22946.1 ABC-type glycerol-3-phosphate transport system, substrate-binding protein [Microlunatus soli]